MGYPSENRLFQNMGLYLMYKSEVSFDIERGNQSRTLYNNIVTEFIPQTGIVLIFQDKDDSRKYLELSIKTVCYKIEEMNFILFCTIKYCDYDTDIMTFDDLTETMNRFGFH